MKMTIEELEEYLLDHYRNGWSERCFLFAAQEDGSKGCELTFFTSMTCKLWAAEYERTRLPLIIFFDDKRQ